MPAGQGGSYEEEGLAGTITSTLATMGERVDGLHYGIAEGGRPWQYHCGGRSVLEICHIHRSPETSDSGDYCAPLLCADCEILGPPQRYCERPGCQVHRDLLDR